jgi:hypothetical protein
MGERKWPTLEDIMAAENHLFPGMASFGETGWRLWTEEEVRQIKDMAQAIMERRRPGGPKPS